MRKLGTVALLLLLVTRVLSAQVQKRETALIRTPTGTVRIMATSEGHVEIIGSDAIQYILVQVPPSAAVQWVDTATKIMQVKNTPGASVETHYRTTFLIDPLDESSSVSLSRVVGGRQPGILLSVSDYPVYHVAINVTTARFAALRKGLMDAARLARLMHERVLASQPPPEPKWAYNTELPAQYRDDNPSPTYPDVLQASNVEGSVEVQFVVKNAGVPDVATMKVRRSSHDLFTAAVRNILPQLRYDPAEEGGRKVPQWVIKTFDFELP